MANYEQITQGLIDAGLINGNIVYHFQNNQWRELFQLYFDFAYGELDEYQDEYKINPAHFYYANDPEVNACAYSRNEHKFISINRGAMEDLWIFYTNHDEIFDDERFTHYRDIANHKGIDAEYLLYQYTTLYFFYHELGHLIQHNDDCKPFSLRENLSDNGDVAQVLYDQTLEFDADWFAATQLAFRMVGYYRNEENGNLECTVKQLTDIVSMGLSAMFNYYVLSAHRFPEIYYKEKSHPHPFVRITYVLTFITDNINPNLPENFQVDYRAALANAVLLSEQLLMRGGFNQAMNFAGIFLREGDRIEAEVNWIKAEADKNPNLCVNKLTKGK